MRGLTNLPHIGPHPGIFFVIFFIFLTGLIGGIRGSIIGFTLGCFLACLIYIPLLIAGSIDRSKTSDRLVQLKYEQYERALLGG